MNESYADLQAKVHAASTLRQSEVPDAPLDAGELHQRCNAASEILEGLSHLGTQLGGLVERLEGPANGETGQTPPRPVRAGLIGQLNDTQDLMDEEIRRIHGHVDSLQRLL